MNLNILFIVMFAVVTAVLFAVAFLYGARELRKKKLCTAKTVGKVVRYSLFVHQGDQSLPVVRYAVDGKPYKIVGPTFRGSVTTTSSTPFNGPVSEVFSNLTDTENLPEVLVTKVKKNSFASVTVTSLRDLFPIGKEVDVFYNPKKPKMAYAVRYARPFAFVIFWLPLIFGILFLALTIGSVFFPPFPM